MHVIGAILYLSLVHGTI